MTGESKEIVKTLLEGIRKPKVVQQLCAPDVTYVSLNYSNPDLLSIPPTRPAARAVKVEETLLPMVSRIGFWTSGRQFFPYRIMEGLPVIPPELSAAVPADSPHAYWRSKSPGLPTQAGLCLDCIRAA